MLKNINEFSHFDILFNDSIADKNLQPSNPGIKRELITISNNEINASNLMKSYIVGGN